jgi:hypothetical protein
VSAAAAETNAASSVATTYQTRPALNLILAARAERIRADAPSRSRCDSRYSHIPE